MHAEDVDKDASKDTLTAVSMHAEDVDKVSSLTNPASYTKGNPTQESSNHMDLNMPKPVTFIVSATLSLFCSRRFNSASNFT